MSVQRFEISAGVPDGITVLEASAGTGKTYTIAALATRFVADGVPIDRLLMITFTRLATGELRERVRSRMASVHDALVSGDGDDDEVVKLLSQGSDEEVGIRCRNLARALSSFDAATVETTHAFCHLMLKGLGVAGDVDPADTLVESVRDLADEVVDDLYVRLGQKDDPPFDRDEALAIGRVAAVDHPGIDIAPAPAGGTAERRVKLAHAVRDELDRRKRMAASLGYDDLLTRLHAAVFGQEGDHVVERLRARYDVVLVDEFQDTDPVQWEIVQRAFGDGARPLVLIGDPKQAIYAFRGADVYAYLRAAKAAGPAQTRTLGVNWRSDAGLLEALEALFGGARLGHPDIVSRPVEHPPAHAFPRLSGAPVAAPLRLRILEAGKPGLEHTQRGHIAASSAREHIAGDCAADIVELLESGARIEVRGENGAVKDRQTVAPGHIAVLTRKHAMARDVRARLQAAGVPAVISGAGSVFDTRAAGDWLTLLRALERPASMSTARATALTPFLGWTAEKIDTAGDSAWEELHRRLHQWARILRVRGVAALMERITLTEALPQRLLSTAGGERDLTDLRHVGQLLHAAAQADHLGHAALTTWLRRRIDEAGEDLDRDEMTRRLESDAEAVQILTIHTSKGLEFPIVYCPDGFEASWIKDGDTGPVTFHDPGDDDRWKLDVSGEGDDHRRQATVEQRGEDLRLLYVALTRARHQVTIWLADTQNSFTGPLARLLTCRDADGNVDPDGRRGPCIDAVRAALEERFAGDAGAQLSVESARTDRSPWYSPPDEPLPALEVASFDRVLDWSWRRLSYSAITAGSEVPLVGSEHEESVIEDEAGLGAPPVPGSDDSELRSLPSPLAAMPGGARIGTLVHRALEKVDFAAGDLEAEVLAAVVEERDWRGLDVGPVEELTAGLTGALRTPLGPLGGDRALAGIQRGDRLDELAFELPLVGGDEPTAVLALRDIAALLREHLAADDPLGGYAARLDDPQLTHALRGYLTGSIDLLARVGTGGQPRYLVADYKTNRLAHGDDEVSAWHYRPAALQAEMERSHYGLQALLYAVAAHRFLRWRDSQYDPDESIVGVHYLFVRGMYGPGGPNSGGVPSGVFSWRPPGALLVALSDLLDRGAQA